MPLFLVHSSIFVECLPWVSGYHPPHPNSSTLHLAKCFWGAVHWSWRDFFSWLPIADPSDESGSTQSSHGNPVFSAQDHPIPFSKVKLWRLLSQTTSTSDVWSWDPRFWVPTSDSQWNPQGRSRCKLRIMTGIRIWYFEVGKAENGCSKLDLYQPKHRFKFPPNPHLVEETVYTNTKIWM